MSTHYRSQLCALSDIAYCICCLFGYSLHQVSMQDGAVAELQTSSSHLNMLHVQVWNYGLGCSVSHSQSKVCTHPFNAIQMHIMRL